MEEPTGDSHPSLSVVSDALQKFNVAYIQDIWAKSLARRSEDPDGAITLARTLLESVCKHILDANKVQYWQGTNLHKLYEQTAKSLEIAPTQHSEPVFNSLFEACASIVQAVGSLRNHIGDAHGKGAFSSLPDWRHAELAVHLAGAMATYLLATWESRQKTTGELVDRFLAESRSGKGLGASHVYALQMLKRYDISKSVASKLSLQQLREHCLARIGDGVDPSTIMQDIVYLGGVFKHARTKWALEVPAQIFTEARPVLLAEGLISKSKERARRLTHAEFDALIAFHRTQDVDSKMKMAVVMEFAIWSGRTISDICKLKWSDLNGLQRTCVVDGEKFRLLGKAWDVIQAQSKVDGEDRIFPYNAKSAGQRHTRAKKQLGITDLTFQDLRFEAISRLLEAGYAPHEVSRAVGLKNLDKINRIYDQIKGED